MLPEQLYFLYDKAKYISKNKGITSFSFLDMNLEEFFLITDSFNKINHLLGEPFNHNIIVQKKTIQLYNK
jgi:hypothetical protein